MARDGEGATTLIEVRVDGASDEAQAKRVAKAIVNSPLVKTAVNGADPNWGRVAMAIGKCSDDIDIDQERVVIRFGAQEVYPQPVDEAGSGRPGRDHAGRRGAHPREPGHRPRARSRCTGATCPISTCASTRTTRRDQAQRGWGAGRPGPSLAEAVAALPRARLATLPTPLEEGPRLPGGARLWVKRDDLTGLGMGGNKARKLELLCGAALAEGADTLVTVGAGQSNHCRMTAAAGARLGLPVHLVLGGDAPAQPAGNQLLSALFGAELHFVGTTSWPELEAAKDALAASLRADGRRPYAIPIGGSTAIGAAGFAAAFAELVDQCQATGCRPRAVVHASSSGGTHAGLLAGRAVLAATDGAGSGRAGAGRLCPR